MTSLYSLGRMRRHDSYFRRQRRWLDHSRLSTVARDQLKLIVGEMRGEQKWFVTAPVRVNSMSIPHNVSSVMGAASNLQSSAAWILNDFVSICPIFTYWCEYLSSEQLSCEHMSVNCITRPTQFALILMLKIVIAIRLPCFIVVPMIIQNWLIYRPWYERQRLM